MLVFMIMKSRKLKTQQLLNHQCNLIPKLRTTATLMNSYNQKPYATILIVITRKIEIRVYKLPQLRFNKKKLRSQWHNHLCLNLSFRLSNINLQLLKMKYLQLNLILKICLINHWLIYQCPNLSIRFPNLLMTNKIKHQILFILIILRLKQI